MTFSKEADDATSSEGEGERQKAAIYRDSQTQMRATLSQIRQIDFVIAPGAEPIMQHHSRLQYRRGRVGMIVDLADGHAIE